MDQQVRVRIAQYIGVLNLCYDKVIECIRSSEISDRSVFDDNWLIIKGRCLKELEHLIKDKENYSISLGTIAIGILGNEPILPPEQLRRDISFIKEAGFNRITIFRLGGLNKDYIKILKKFK